MLALLKRMRGAVKEQRSIDIFWHTLTDLVQCGRVRLDESVIDSKAPVIGKYLPAGRHRVHISSEMALAEVQKSLADQRRPALPLRPNELPGLLRKEGRLCDKSGHPVPADSSGLGNSQQRLERGGPARRGFIVPVAAFRARDEENTPLSGIPGAAG